MGHDLFDDDDDNIHRGFLSHLGDKSPPKQQQQRRGKVRKNKHFGSIVYLEYAMKFQMINKAFWANLIHHVIDQRGDLQKIQTYGYDWLDVFFKN